MNEAAAKHYIAYVQRYYPERLGKPASVSIQDDICEL